MSGSVASGWQFAETRRLLDWFNIHLARPGRLAYQPGRLTSRSGICWFRHSARVHIERARNQAWLVSELGAPIAERRTRDPGRVLWSDRHQVVASRHLN